MITEKTSNLFLFIDYLHANINNFGKYNRVYIDYIYASNKIGDLGTHYKEKREKKALKQKTKKQFDLLINKVVNPIKDKVAELDLFDWDTPETITENYLNAVLVLSKECDDEDVEVILKAKRQYIEFTNKVGTDIISIQGSTLFKYLNDVMIVIAKDFNEEGDKPINKSGAINIIDNPYFEDYEDYDYDYDFIGEEIKKAIYSNENKSSKIDNVYNRIELFVDGKLVAFDVDNFYTETVNEYETYCRHIELQTKLIQDINILYLEGKIDTLKQMRNLLLYKLKVINKPSLFMCSYQFEEISRIKTQYINKVVNAIDNLLAQTANNDTQLATAALSETKSVATKTIVEQTVQQDTNPTTYHAKHYALAFIFDCLATGESFIQFDGKKYQLETIGEKRVNGAISANTFYKAFNSIMNEKLDFEKDKDMIYYAGQNWKEIIIKLSHEPRKVSEYLEKREL